MKRTNPIVLRLGLSRNWDNNINVLNYKESIPFLIKTGEFMQNYINSMSLNNGGSFCVPIQTTSVISGRILVVNLFYSFLNQVIYFKKGKGLVLYNSAFFLNRIFYRVETMFWRTFRFVLKIKAFNYYRQLILNSYLKQTAAFLTNYNDNLQNLSHLFLVALYFKNAYFFAYLIGMEIRKKKHHFRTLGQLTEIVSSVFLYINSIQCLVVQISGRFNNKDKSQTKILNFGNTAALQTFNVNVSYGYSNVITPIGVFGIRCWLY